MGIALAITAIGMTLLFLTLAFFYGLLTLMASVIEDRRSGNTRPAAEPPADQDEEAVLRAAAIAVALARASAEGSATATGIPPRAEPPAGPSPWWALHHQRSLRSDSLARRPR